jgi:putative ATP-binding cassette transporter
MENWWGIMVATKRLTFFTAGYTQVAMVFPFIVASPRYFSGEIPLGGLTQTANAFGEVQGALSWFVDNYARLTEWRATVKRLTGFQQAIRTAQAATAAGDGVRAEPGPGPDLVLEDVGLRVPGGRQLISGAAARIAPGDSVLIAGPSGSGKSTLFRAIAGIWPFGSGRVRVPEGAQVLFLPQRPYLPLGTLRRALCYPDRLDEEDSWGQRLSGGEQQRIALARALLLKPDWLFLDEATASLDPEGEQRFYALLKERLPGATLVSIAHRPAVALYHDRAFRVREGALMVGPTAPAG